MHMCICIYAVTITALVENENGNEVSTHIRSAESRSFAYTYMDDEYVLCRCILYCRFRFHKIFSWYNDCESLHREL